LPQAVRNSAAARQAAAAAHKRLPKVLLRITVVLPYVRGVWPAPGKSVVYAVIRQRAATTSNAEQRTGESAYRSVSSAVNQHEVELYMTCILVNRITRCNGFAVVFPVAQVSALSRIRPHRRFAIAPLHRPPHRNGSSILVLADLRA